MLFVQIELNHFSYIFQFVFHHFQQISCHPFSVSFLLEFFMSWFLWSYCEIFSGMTNLRAPGIIMSFKFIYLSLESEDVDGRFRPLCPFSPLSIGPKVIKPNFKVRNQTIRLAKFNFRSITGFPLLCEFLVHAFRWLGKNGGLLKGPRKLLRFVWSSHRGFAGTFD